MDSNAEQVSKGLEGKGGVTKGTKKPEKKKVLKAVSARSIPQATRLRLVAAAAGRCALCRNFLYEHHLTGDEGNFSENAHICAFGEGGPRADEKMSTKRVHAFENLVLLDAACHHLIDTDVSAWPTDRVRDLKRDHELLMRSSTESTPEQRTVPLVFKARIAAQHIDVSNDNIRQAIAPRYVAGRRVERIDLTSNSLATPADYAKGLQALRRDLHRILNGDTVEHYSVFALAPIPLLVAFGRELGDKVDADLFQRHHGTQDWRWKNGTNIVEFETLVRNEPKHVRAIGLVLALSGHVTSESIPNAADTLLFELRPKGVEPDRELLRTKADLSSYRRALRAALSLIAARNPKSAPLRLFPAAGITASIVTGQDLYPKVDPVIEVFDNINNAFTYCISVNEKDQLQ